jgi:hypothetical protein
MSEPEEKKQAFVFGGFDSPNTTQVPDAFFDVVAPELSEAELRVALYIIRRTFGFKKDSDNISLRQMVEGITTKDGRVLDRGTGLRKSAVANALNGLERKGVILSKRNRSAERGNEPTTYALNIKNHPLSVPVDKGLSIYADKGLSVPVDTQYTVEQETVLQQTDISSNGFEEDANLQQRFDSEFSKKRDAFQVKAALPEQPEMHQGSSAKRGLTPIAEALSTTARKLAPRSPKSGPETAADPLGGNKTGGAPKRSRGRPPKAPPQIEWIITQVSGEFHDEEHTASNLSQAARLWKASGQSEGAFYNLVGEARSITKTYDIQKRASGEAGEYGFRNKMPYFFSVLRDLLGMKEIQAESRG